MRKIILMALAVLALDLIGLSTVTHAQAASATVTWQDMSNNEDGFGIERKLGTGGTYAEIGRTGVNIATYSDLGLAYGVTYCYRIYAFNAAGKSAYSPETCATGVDPKPATPGKPTVTIQ